MQGLRKKVCPRGEWGMQGMQVSCGFETSKRDKKQEGGKEWMKKS